jgi:uncharacterized membrane protein YfcA
VTPPQIPLWVLPLVAFGISLLTSTAGISGAFLLVPFQVSVLGIATPSVSGTNLVFNLLAIPGGVYRYVRERRMLWPLAGLVAAASVPGVVLGAWVRVSWLPDPRAFRTFVGCVLLYLGLRMLVEEVRRRGRARVPSNRAAGSLFPAVRVLALTRSRFEYEFDGERFAVPVWPVVALSAAVGVVGGAYGIGGGVLMVPFFVSIFRLPIFTVAGATLFSTWATSAAGALTYQGLAGFHPELSVAPDWSVGLLFGVGGFLGTYFGARLQKHVPGAAIRWMLTALILFAGCRYLADLLR